MITIKIIRLKDSNNKRKTSLNPTEKRLPQRMLKAVPVATPPGINERKINASAIIIENKKPMIILLSNRAFSERGPSINAVLKANIIAVIVGSNEISNPNAAPANDA